MKTRSHIKTKLTFTLLPRRAGQLRASRCGSGSRGGGEGVFRMLPVQRCRVACLHGSFHSRNVLLIAVTVALTDIRSEQSDADPGRFLLLSCLSTYSMLNADFRLISGCYV